MQAVAAVLQEDTSALVTLASSGLDRPAKLDGKVRCRRDADAEYALCALGAGLKDAPLCGNS